VASTPVENALFYLGMNVKPGPPFNNVKVRQAVAWAMPYDKIMDIGDVQARRSAMYGGKQQGQDACMAAAARLQATDIDQGARR
jgi:ABC-type transport system substrate-binding protein